MLLKRWVLGKEYFCLEPERLRECRDRSSYAINNFITHYNHPIAR